MSNKTEDAGPDNSKELLSAIKEMVELSKENSDKLFNLLSDTKLNDVHAHTLLSIVKQEFEYQKTFTGLMLQGMVQDQMWLGTVAKDLIDEKCFAKKGETT